MIRKKKVSVLVRMCRPVSEDTLEMYYGIFKEIHREEELKERHTSKSVILVLVRR